MRGIDVSHYQGVIDWQTLSEQNIRFAFIKATEGSSTVDERFADNWNNVSRTELYAGAYHFFSFDSPASSQAALFIETVGNLEGKLPPVIDIEYYGDKRQSPPDQEAVAESLQELLVILEDEYDAKPIIYTTYPVYRRYIKGHFDDYPLWIRNVYYTPDLSPGLNWQFWQYSDTAVLNGYQGDEACIDMNAFSGTENQLRQYLVQNAAALK